jgi:hypothetical protein
MASDNSFGRRIFRYESSTDALLKNSPNIELEAAGLLLFTNYRKLICERYY